jgi:hypothetical protein
LEVWSLQSPRASDQVIYPSIQNYGGRHSHCVSHDQNMLVHAGEDVFMHPEGRHVECLYWYTSRSWCASDLVGIYMPLTHARSALKGLHTCTLHRQCLHWHPALYDALQMVQGTFDLLESGVPHTKLGLLRSG